MLLVIPVILFSCLHLRAVYYPEVVKTNSTFEVVMVADMKNPLDGGNTERFGYGFAGVLLPVGWTIDEESVTYEYTGIDPNKDYGAEPQKANGKLLFSQEMTDYCIELDPEKWGEEYYWQGFRTEGRLHSENMDSIVIKFNVTTNDQVGEYLMLVGIQETSYDKDESIPAGEPGNTLMDNKGDGPFYKCGDPGSDEFSRDYLMITVEQENGIGVKYSEKDKENYAVSSAGNGQVLVRLQNEAKKGAVSVIYDMNGRQVASQQLTQMDNVLNTTLKPGVYFISIQKDGVRSTQKVLVK
ncbi:hypothetical protein AGMMS50262_02460 [Bacteroidia bacterium]|nr:hypothetical protein AGMMS50262_02460 [Bacteroidia bacterium]